MFQRIKGAIDRTIAEEQARQKAYVDRTSESSSPSRRSTSATRNASASRGPPARRPRTKKPTSKETNGDSSTLSPDPAVFEAAFVIDDSDDTVQAPSPMPTPIPAEKEKAPDGVERSEKEPGGVEEKDSGTTTEAPAAPTEKAELPPEVRAKLRKLEKLESTYPELLRSYRIAHSRATSIEPFERALRENTPLTSIKDPDALVEYLNQLQLKADMVMDEFKRVSSERDDLKKKHDDSSKELEALNKEVTTLRAGRTGDGEPEKPKSSIDLHGGADKEKGDGGHSRTASASKSPVTQVLSIFSPKHKAQPAEEVKDSEEEFFSYESEIPQLQAEVEAKNEEIAGLKTELESLRGEVSAAKETSAGLAEALEKATRQLGDSGDAADAQATLQAQLDAKSTELATLTSRFEVAQSQLRDLEKQLEEGKKQLQAAVGDHTTELTVATNRADQLDEEAKMAAEARAGLERTVSELTAEMDLLKKSKAQNEEEINRLTKEAQAAVPVAPPSRVPSPSSAEPPSTQSAAAKKKNKRKKKGAAGATSQEPTASETPDEGSAPAAERSDDAVLRADLDKLRAEVAEKDKEIERLAQRRKTEEDLREEIETLQDNLVHIGQDHVDAKEKIKALEAENATLKDRIAELAKQLASTSSIAKGSSKMQGDYDQLKRELEQLTVKSATLQSDCAAAQQLAQSRYKDLTDLREVLQKAQPELKSLRQESAALKTVKEELTIKDSMLATLEKREKELKNEVSRAQRLVADREGEIKTLRDRLTTETNARTRLEDERRVAGRDLRRAEADKIELSAKEEKASRELQRVQDEMTRLRPRIAELEEQTSRSRSESERLREEASLKSSQYGAAQDLLASMRDQMAELGVRLKESQSQAEGLDEELAETRKLLGERTREAETMRRLLADVDERADTKVRDMKTRLDAATEERDRLEDEASAGARRRAREGEELRGRIRDLERENRSLASERDELETQAKEWRRRREELEAVEGKHDVELAEVRGTVTNLRSTLDASEAQVRDAERQRAELRRAVDEYRVRYDKLAKECKSLQSRLAIGSPSGRSSMDSNRSGNPAASTNGGATAAGGAGASGGSSSDVMYLKTVLLQFLEQKDNKLRAQLVPVLGKLLRFDKSDEQKWLAAVQHIGTK